MRPMIRSLLVVALLVPLALSQGLEYVLTGLGVESVNELITGVSHRARSL